MKSKAMESVVASENQSSIRIFGRVVAEDMSMAEFDLVSGGAANLETKATDGNMQCDW